jgi:hypothetical protein
MNLYTHEKLMELERERLARHRPAPPTKARPRRTIFGPLATFSGRALRRVGEGLESWGAPPRPLEPDQRRSTRRVVRQ